MLVKKNILEFTSEELRVIENFHSIYQNQSHKRIVEKWLRKKKAQKEQAELIHLKNNIKKKIHKILSISTRNYKRILSTNLNETMSRTISKNTETPQSSKMPQKNQLFIIESLCNYHDFFSHKATSFVHDIMKPIWKLFLTHLSNHNNKDILEECNKLELASMLSDNEKDDHDENQVWYWVKDLHTDIKKQEMKKYFIDYLDRFFCSDLYKIQRPQITYKIQLFVKLLLNCNKNPELFDKNQLNPKFEYFIPRI